MSAGSTTGIGAEGLASKEPGTPLYLAVRNALADHISTGRLQPSGQLPSERVLCERFGVSRVTLRRALHALAEEHLIRASAGRGWFVSEDTLSEPPDALLSFTEMARARGLSPSARVLRAEVRVASIDEAEVLGIVPGAEVLDLQRVRLLNELPVALDATLLALDRCPGIERYDFSTASLYGTLRERAGLMPSYAECTLEALGAHDDVAEHLDIVEGAPVLVSRQRTFDQSGVCFETGRIYYRGDRYRLRTTMLAPGDRGFPAVTHT